MPISTPHREYSAAAHQWLRCRDAYLGTDAIKARKRTYLPALEGMTDETQYENYVLRALFYPATERTVSGLSGMIVRRPAVVTANDVVRDQMSDVTLTGTSLDGYVLAAVQEVLITGRCGTLVDMPPEATPESRPYWVLYDAEDILNWAEARNPVTGQMELIALVLRETLWVPDPTDPYKSVATMQYRECRVVNGVYTQTLWRPSASDKTQFLREATYTPVRRGQPLTQIPFVFFGPRNIEASVDKPPLLDLVDVNVSHYRTMADLEHGRHFTALPTPWVTGYSEVIGPDGKPGKLAIGAGTAWTMPDPQAKVGMLEFSGAGLKELREAALHKEQLMAILGARLLESQPRQAETAEAVKMRHAGEAATLGSVVAALNEGFSRAVQWHAWWLAFEVDGQPDAEIRIDLNRDFFETQLDASTLANLMAAWQGGAMSYETFFYNLQRGELARPGVTAEEELKEIQEEQAEAQLLQQDATDEVAEETAEETEAAGLEPVEPGVTEQAESATEVAPA
jgi:hypothetical protein